MWLASMKIKIYFSDVFDLSPNVVQEYGALDVSLINDLPLFIDPFLLFNSRKPEYQQLHNQMIDYLKFLRDRCAGGPLTPGLIYAWFRFPEIRQNWLGYSLAGNAGRGLGPTFANALHNNLHTVFKHFGNEQITRGAHLEKLCLIKDGVGRDNISDFATNLIKGFLLEYTEAFASEHIRSELRKKVHIPRVAFNYSTQSWQTQEFDLPWVYGDYVILTPRDLLTKDDTWISRADLIRRYDGIAASIPNQQLRDQLNNYFVSALPKRRDKQPSEKERQEAAARVVDKFPEVIEYYIAEKEKTGDEAESVSARRVKESERLLIENVRKLASLLGESPFYRIPAARITFDDAMARVQFLKDVIENKGGHRIFYINGQPVQREKDLHILYRLTWFASVVAIDAEVNNGRGPVDYSASYGAADKTLVEFKLASNSHLAKNLTHQTKVYEKAGDARESITVITYFSKEELGRVERILQELRRDKDKTIVLIDARSDNKPSGSKA
jgi:hypothetical protein